MDLARCGLARRSMYYDPRGQRSTFLGKVAVCAKFGTLMASHFGRWEELEQPMVKVAGVEASGDEERVA